MRVFNTAGKCIPSIHYMVNIDRQVEDAAKLVRAGNYFCINRGRQFGKTTTLSFLKKKLEKEGYAVFSISFEGLEDEAYESLQTLLYMSLCIMQQCVEWDNVRNLSDSAIELLKKYDGEEIQEISTLQFGKVIGKINNENKVVLLIDEVDQAGNHEAFIKFLGLLRDMYLKRDERPCFQSVILAGVYDIMNLKLKIRPEEQHQYNSPWNIAVPFDTDMTLQPDGIAGMLQEYKADHNLDFDETSVAKLVYDYTSGYPFLVSRICQIIDNEHYSWDKEGVLKACHDLLTERNTLFDDMVKKLDSFPELKKLLRTVLFEGVSRTFYADEKFLQIGEMFNFIKNDHGNVAIMCRLMETRLYNIFIGENQTSQIFEEGQLDKNQFIHDGYIDMRLLLDKFAAHFNEIYRPGKDDRFVEEQGRKIFLTYLRPIINGIGNYYCEAQTRDLTRTDVVIDYLGQQYVVELKIWRGQSYNERGEQQLSEYLDFFGLQSGYMLSFCFNQNKTPGGHDVSVGDRKIYEVIV